MSRLTSARQMTPLALAAAGFVALGLTAGATGDRAGRQDATRPRITALSHIAVFVSDLDAARGFYSGLLGLREEPAAGPDVPQRALFRINPTQYVEAIVGSGEGEGQLHHVAFATDRLEPLRALFDERHVSLVGGIQADAAGEPALMVHDPDGHRVEFVEHRAAAGGTAAAPSTSAVSTHAWHAGVLVGDLAAAQTFYADVLGYTEFWRGAPPGSTFLSWVNMRVPDGDDYLELMLYVNKPAPDKRGSAHHLCLQVPDMDAALARIERSPSRASYTPPLTIRTGINRRRQLNLFDPDGTRVELMESQTVDGHPPANSTLPAPRKEGF